MFFFWWTKGRDPKADISVAPMYEPPEGMTPAEVGSLMDDAVHPRDITSTLVDLAVKGYLKIEETESKTLLFSHRDYTFHLLKPQPRVEHAGGARARDAESHVSRRGHRDTAIGFAQPVLRGDPDHQGRHPGGTERAKECTRSIPTRRTPMCWPGWCLPRCRSSLRKCWAGVDAGFARAADRRGPDRVWSLSSCSRAS